MILTIEYTTISGKVHTIACYEYKRKDSGLVVKTRRTGTERETIVNVKSVREV